MTADFYAGARVELDRDQVNEAFGSATLSNSKIPRRADSTLRYRPWSCRYAAPRHPPLPRPTPASLEVAVGKLSIDDEPKISAPLSSTSAPAKRRAAERIAQRKQQVKQFFRRLGKFIPGRRKRANASKDVLPADNVERTDLNPARTVPFDLPSIQTPMRRHTPVTLTTGSHAGKTTLEIVGSPCTLWTNRSLLPFPGRVLKPVRRGSGPYEPWYGEAGKDDPWERKKRIRPSPDPQLWATTPCEADVDTARPRRVKFRHQPATEVREFEPWYFDTWGVCPPPNDDFDDDDDEDDEDEEEKKVETPVLTDDSSDSDSDSDSAFSEVDLLAEGIFFGIGTEVLAKSEQAEPQETSTTGAPSEAPVDTANARWRPALRTIPELDENAADNSPSSEECPPIDNAKEVLEYVARNYPIVAGPSLEEAWALNFGDDDDSDDEMI